MSLKIKANKELSSLLKGSEVMIVDMAPSFYLYKGFLPSIEECMGEIVEVRNVVSGSPGKRTVTQWFRVVLKLLHPANSWYSGTTHDIPMNMLLIKDYYGEQGSLSFRWKSMKTYLDKEGFGKEPDPSVITFNGREGSVIQRMSSFGLWVLFKEDVGGSSLDGYYPKGSVLFLTHEEIKKNQEEKNKELEEKAKPKKRSTNYKSKKKKNGG
jgi:hypothetical protein